MFFFCFAGLAQGMVTGMRGLCNGLGPAVFGLIFYIFHVDLNEDEARLNAVDQSTKGFAGLGMTQVGNYSGDVPQHRLSGHVSGEMNTNELLWIMV